MKATAFLKYIIMHSISGGDEISHDKQFTLNSYSPDTHRIENLTVSSHRLGRAGLDPPL